jgi:hypothetical protein
MSQTRTHKTHTSMSYTGYTGSQPLFPQYQQKMRDGHRDSRGGSSLSEREDGSAEVFNTAGTPYSCNMYTHYTIIDTMYHNNRHNYMHTPYTN